jgi:hypothetical protein
MVDQAAAAATRGLCDVVTVLSHDPPDESDDARIRVPAVPPSACSIIRSRRYPDTPAYPCRAARRRDK